MTLDGQAYTSREIWIVVRIQCAFRMWLAKRRVQHLRNELYNPGMMHMHNGAGDDYENINVQDMRAQLGPFNYDDYAYEKTLGQREIRQMVLLENGAQYEGQWLRGS